jgi:hypothetical protein
MMCCLRLFHEGLCVGAYYGVRFVLVAMVAMVAMVGSLSGFNFSVS